MGKSTEDYSRVAAMFVLLGIAGLMWWATESWVASISSVLLIIGMCTLIHKAIKDVETGK